MDVGLREVAGIWAGLGILTVAVLSTYARFPVSEFYNVSIEGFPGALSRTLVLLNFPIAFIGLALMGFALARLYATPDALNPAERRIVGIAAAVAAVLSLVAGFVVEQSDLDAKPANALPAIGVVLALGVTVLALRRTGAGAPQAWAASDTFRLIVIGALCLAALPWIFADLGVFVGDIPLLGRLYMSKEILAGDTQPAVHLGHHHGFDGVIFAVAALLLTRQLGRLRGTLRWPLTAYVALMLVYGLANGLQDFWGEQLVKRGWTDMHVPTVAAPAIKPAWGLILLGTAIVAIVLYYTTRPHDDSRIPAAV